MLTEEVRRWRRGGYTVVLLVTSASRARQLLSALQDKNIDAFYAGNLTGHIRQGNVIVTIGHLSGGFEFPSCSLVVITETEIYGQRRRSRKEKLPASSLSPFTDLKVGDYVVHVNHGIARYLGIVSLTISNVRKEYLLLKYAGEDKLYVPVDQVELIQKYLGGEGEAPRLSRLGGGDWARVKSRVKSAVQEIAQELLTLYKARETIAGRAYNPDTVWQQEFEAAFPYEETPDQLRAIEEVKADLERPRPMDRLLCGDVGYGKTEVALRAAFKVVMDSKQVAVLVPTTILAQQHYNTFLERFAGYPVSIEVLSRFRTPREQRQVLAGLERGTVDIVIGTHRLLQEDVRFKDIGLLVVDEEQRFGVTHKERLKFLRRDVDVITLTATPIPRTLHMSLVGARDTSILETPPEGRYPVQTYVVEEDPVLIREAIRRELSRGGQVFFVYNRILNLDRLALWLQELVPEARMAVAHGQMREEDLEQVMLDFLSGSFDVLVCTTIIENGLDIANVNTLIVKEANMMGLAQLYQLRGRVGRSNRLAYAYFTFRKDHMLGEAAEKRLSAIREFTEFGSGFKIAMRDLEIRGAGNILGSEQHGHIAAVGFDLYCRLLDEAVREAKGELVTPPLETVIELPVEAYIPDEYIADINQKVEVYRRIASLCSTAGLDDLADELADRFGNLPVQAQNLLAVARIKALGSQLRIKTVSFLPDQYRLQFDANPPLSGEVLVALSKEYLNMIKFNSSNGNFEIKVRINKADGELDQLEEFLKKLQPARRQF
jgi:transcription-repair coupling factor (superfamily II helicase)